MSLYFTTSPGGRPASQALRPNPSVRNHSISGGRQDVIASVAKQSPAQWIWGLLRRFTPRNDSHDERICPTKQNDYFSPFFLLDSGVRNRICECSDLFRAFSYFVLGKLDELGQSLKQAGHTKLRSKKYSVPVRDRVSKSPLTPLFQRGAGGISPFRT